MERIQNAREGFGYLTVAKEHEKDICYGYQCQAALERELASECFGKAGLNKLARKQTEKAAKFWKYMARHFGEEEDGDYLACVLTLDWKNIPLSEKVAALIERPRMYGGGYVADTVYEEFKDLLREEADRATEEYEHQFS